MKIENYSLNSTDEEKRDKVLVLVIYDISDNKRRTKFVKLLNGYGFRVQKSAFEAIVTKKIYQQLLNAVQNFAVDDENIRVYKIIGYSEVHSFGTYRNIEDEEVIIT